MKNKLDSSKTTSNILLTLLVTLKGRLEYTKRLCRYLSNIKFPYNVLFADGSEDEETRLFFESEHNISFSYTYLRYPEDTSLKAYYSKCADTVSKITTPYVMLVDNDDFIITSGVEKSLKFLENNTNHIGCCGRIAGVELFDKSENMVYGSSALFYPYYCNQQDSPSTGLDSEEALDRIIVFIKTWKSVYYSVFRTEALQRTFNEINFLSPTDLGVFELFFSLRMLSFGKISLQTQYITYVRQRGTSQAAATRSHFFERLFNSDWLKDQKKVIDYIAGKLDYNNAEFNIKIITKAITSKCYEIFILNPDLKIGKFRFIFSKAYFLDIIFRKIHIILGKIRLSFLSIQLSKIRSVSYNNAEDFKNNYKAIIYIQKFLGELQ